TTTVPRLVRMYFELWLIRRWRLPATPRLSFPDAVWENRFAAACLVFIFGISVSCGRQSDPKIPLGINGATPEISPGRHAISPSGPVEGAVYTRKARKSKRLWRRAVGRSFRFGSQSIRR